MTRGRRIRGAGCGAPIARIANRLGVAIAVSIAMQSGCGGDEDRMAAIRKLQTAGRFEASIEPVRAILAETPEHGEANFRLGVALVRTGNPSRAIWALEKASESSEFAIPANLELAAAQFELENFEASIRASDRVLAVEPDRLEALRLNARAHVGARQLEEALIDTTRVLEIDANDYEILIVHATVLAELGRTQEAESAHQRIKEVSAASGDEELAARGCLAPALFARVDVGDLERAEALYEDCAAKYPGNVSVVAHIANFFDSTGKPERAIDLMRRAIERAPDNLALHAALATSLARAGRNEAAEATLEAAVERFGVESAGPLLARHYRRQRDPQRALAVIEEIADERGGGSDRLRFLRADLLVDVGEIDRAEALVDQLESPGYKSMIRGRILLERGDSAAALAAFDEGIENWPNNAGGRYLAGIAALRLGDFERASVELRESVRVDDAATDAARMLARLQFDRREYREAVAFSSIAQRHRAPNERAEDLKLDASALAALGEFDRARSATHALAAIQGQAGEAAAQLAMLERIESGPAAAIAAVEKLDLDLRKPTNEPALRALANDYIAVGRAESAIASIDRALRARPKSASLHALMGTTLARSYRSTDARTAFMRALAIDADQPEALGGMAALAGAGGDTARAVELFDRAAAVDPANLSYAYAAAQLLLAAGDREEAEARLRRITRSSAGHAGARNDLAWLLATDERELDLALALAREASRLSPGSATLDTLGFVHIQRGEAAQAVEVLERAVEAPDSSPTSHYHLAIALSAQGNTQRARDFLKRALAAGDFPDARDAQKRLAELEMR